MPRRRFTQGTTTTLTLFRKKDGTAKRFVVEDSWRMGRLVKRSRTTFVGKKLERVENLMAFVWWTTLIRGTLTGKCRHMVNRSRRR